MEATGDVRVGLPSGGELAGVLGDRWEGLGDLVGGALLAPLDEFLRRPAKGFRGTLVRLAYGLAGGAGEPAWCERGAQLLEHLHAGSLVVDDIQDGSLVRRGRPTLHREHGVPVALNAGNWLYFWPLEQVKHWGMPPERELQVYRVCHSGLLQAHFGQAIDVGTPVDRLPQERVPDVCLASLELKTGALTALATGMGAVLGGADDTRRVALEDFGRRFGVALQMLDDLGNLGARAGDPKRWEDLKLRRPSWIWASVARGAPAQGYGAFLAAVRALPEEAALERWIASAADLIREARREAERYLKQALDELRRGLGPHGALDELETLAGRLARSYG